jgi:hypothetical protein
VVSSLVEVLLAEIRARLATETFNAQQLSNLLWALTILRLCTPEVCSSTGGIGQWGDMAPQYWLLLKLRPQHARFKLSRC